MSTRPFVIEIGTALGRKCSRCGLVVEYKVRDIRSDQVFLTAAGNSWIEEWKVTPEGPTSLLLRGCRACLEKLVEPELRAYRKEHASLGMTESCLTTT